ncbi:MAG: alpha/beta hydrolase-fold protein [Chloroherpetonaceae bacterium]|nr:alpha/beta hydrolase-fold protein [Chloroherpetonaceae bacterium]
MSKYLGILTLAAMLLLCAHSPRAQTNASGEVAISLSGEWRITFGFYAASSEALLPAYSDSNWLRVPVPAFWNDYEVLRGFSGLALYRKTVLVPKTAAGKPLYLLLGRINSIDEAYFNGKLIGKTGDVKNPADGELRVYLIPDSLIQYDKPNTLAVRVFCNNLDGGIYAGGGKDKKQLGIYTKTALRSVLGQPATLAADSIARLIRRTVEVMDTMLISRQPEAYMSLVSERYFNNGTSYTEQKLFAQTITQRLAGARITYHDFQVYQVSKDVVVADYDSEIEWQNRSNYLGHDERYFQLQNGKWLEIGNQSRFFDLEINSAYMRRKMTVSVYLPPSFLRERRRLYPALYLLHPQGGSTMIWREIELDRLLDSLIAKKKIVEMVVVMPSEHQSQYVNSKDGKRAFENFFLEELPDLVEEDYRVARRREARAISGVSWGGAAALFLALKTERGQRLFSAVSSLMGMIGYMPSRKPEIDGGDTAFWRPYLAATLLQALPDTSLAKTDLFLLTGDQDPFLQGNQKVAEWLRKRKQKPVLQVLKGSHDFSFWTMHLDKIFEFHSESFRKRLSQK